MSLRSRGAVRCIGIPGDVPVIGFDDIDETRYSLPALATIDPGKDEIANVAVDFLLGRIAHLDAEIPPREHLAEFALVERESGVAGVAT